MPVSIQKERELRRRMERLGVHEEEIEESFVRSSGAGGQKVNKSSTCVLLVHRPTGIHVKCQKERSQALNRFFARRLLLEKIERKIRGERSVEEERIAKIRRQKRRRSKRAQEKILAQKRHQAEKKSRRGPIKPSDFE